MNHMLLTLAKTVKNRIPAGKTIAVAESLTAGLIQSTLASVSGSSAYFAGGVTVYNIDQKVKLLGVNREHAATVNCVSPLVAQEMALGAATLFGTDYAVATTGYAEPCPERGILTPYAEISILQGHITFESVLWGDKLWSRNRMREEVAIYALGSLVRLFSKWS